MLLPTDFAAPPTTLVAAFQERLAHRDDPVLPDTSPEAVAARLDAWLRATYRQRNSLRRHCLSQMLLQLLAQPEAGVEALHTAGGVQLRSGARAIRQLVDWDLICHAYRAGFRYYRLTRAGEDALLPVVKG